MQSNAYICLKRINRMLSHVIIGMKNKKVIIPRLLNTPSLFLWSACEFTEYITIEVNEKKTKLTINAYRIICLSLALFLKKVHSAVDKTKPINRVIKYTILKAPSPHFLLHWLAPYIDSNINIQTKESSHPYFRSEMILIKLFYTSCTDTFTTTSNMFQSGAI